MIRPYYLNRFLEHLQYVTRFWRPVISTLFLAVLEDRIVKHAHVLTEGDENEFLLLELFDRNLNYYRLSVSCVKWKEIDKERNGPYFISEAIFRYASHFLFLKFILNQETNLSSNFLPFELSI